MKEKRRTAKKRDQARDEGAKRRKTERGRREEGEWSEERSKAF